MQCIFVVQALATFQQHGLDHKVNELGESLIFPVIFASAITIPDAHGISVI